MECTKVYGYLFIQLFCIFITFKVTSQSTPGFIVKANNPLLGFIGEAINFTWKYSDHSSKRIYFGIWNTDYGLIEPSLITVNIFPNSTITLHPNDKEFSAKSYVGRVRWFGNATEQRATFELSNIKDSDKKHFGIEVDFFNQTYDSSWTRLIVKPPSIFTFGPEIISTGKDQTANFTWKYSLNDIDTKDLTSITFGVYKNGLFKPLCDIEVRDGLARKQSCSTSFRRAHISSLSPISKAAFGLNKVVLNDDAIYSIRLGGIKRPMESKTTLFVTDRPEIISPPQNTIVTEGGKLNLSCKASGKPKPTITWYKDGRVIEASFDEFYIVNETEKSDDGTYGCYARNKVGVERSSSTARVEIQYAPKINSSRSLMPVHVPIGEKEWLRCPTNANPKPEYKWFADGLLLRDQDSANILVTITSENDYKKYVCKAVNDIGEDNVTFALQQVGPPSQPRVDCDKREDSSNSRTTKFHWNAPDDDGGAPIIRYHVKYRTIKGHLSRGLWKYVKVSNTETWYRLHLDWDTTFEFTVTAWNIYGESPLDTDNTCAVTVGKINGGMSSWSTWSTCSVTCGAGTRVRMRTCNNPKPDNGGLPCTESTVETGECSVQPCIGNPTSIPDPSPSPEIVLSINITTSPITNAENNTNTTIPTTSSSSNETLPSSTPNLTLTNPSPSLNSSKPSPILKTNSTSTKPVSSSPPPTSKPNASLPIPIPAPPKPSPLLPSIPSPSNNAPSTPNANNTVPLLPQYNLILVINKTKPNSTAPKPEPGSPWPPAPTGCKPNQAVVYGFPDYKKCGNGFELITLSPHQLTASSTYSKDTGDKIIKYRHAPYNGLLNNTQNAGAWCAEHQFATSQDSNQYLSVDLGTPTLIGKIATQGMEYWDNWVSTYAVKYSIDNIVWYTYPRTLQGNCDRSTITENILNPPIHARFVRVNPSSWYTSFDPSKHDICMRIAIYKCRDCKLVPVSRCNINVPKKRIKKSKFTQIIRIEDTTKPNGKHRKADDQ